ncbi:MAG TPA: phosphoribosylanthranilate isomerase [Terriglobales bacterium]|nr:phosphoribosylanthranilate isomerase [Terriglobales bacterium]
MQASLRPRVKICCIATLQEAVMAIRHGASAIGLVSQMPSGPGVISENSIAEIAARVPPPIASFLLTCKQDVGSIVAQQRRCGTSTVQICDSLIQGNYAELRRAMPGIGIVQVIHVVGPSSVDEARAVAPEVDAILLDSGNPSVAIKELGGTGRRHDWKLSRKIRESIDVPLFLAGGIKPENVREAIDEVRPFALDICSGVRSNGTLDERKLEALFAALECA